MRCSQAALVGGALFVPVLLAVAVMATSAEPASAHFSHPGLEFHIAVDVNGDTVDDCDTAGGPATCSITIGSDFWVKFYLDDRDGINYAGYDFVFDYTGISSTAMFDYDEWPDCLSPAAAFPPGYGSVGCAVPPAGYNGAPGYSTYEGLMARVGFRCDSSGTMSMRNGPGHQTNIAEPYPYYPYGIHTEDGPDLEPLTIDCVPPTPTPTPTPPPVPPVGGFSRDPRLGPGAGASSEGAVWALVAAIAAGGVVLASAGWYARRRAKG